MSRLLVGSLARIADFDRKTYDVRALERPEWNTGDYVMGEITGKRSVLYNIETTTGEMVEVEPGDRVIGAFGVRAATLEGVGSWMDINDDRMQALTNAGLFGRFTSISPLLAEPVSLRYLGHLLREGSKLRMRDYALKTDGVTFDVPTILLYGTSMSAGKTMTGRLACRVLSDRGYKVIGSKITGAGRYRDIISFRDNGAAEIYDFVDAGLPSTVVPRNEYVDAIRPLLGHIAGRGADYLVAEAGASPLEPYNGETAIAELGDNVRCRILCASDPYAVVGVQEAFGLTPHLVTGPATNTSAGIDLVRKLTGVHGINILDPEALPEFRDFLLQILDVDEVRT